VAKEIVDGVFDADDRKAAVEHVLAMLQLVKRREDVMTLGRELSILRGQTSDPPRQVACSELAECLYRNMVPMQPPLMGALDAVLTLIAICGAVVVGHPVIALALTTALVAFLARISLFLIRTHRANPMDPARLPSQSELLALRCVRTTGVAKAK
jgi:hypothetical protein